MFHVTTTRIDDGQFSSFEQVFTDEAKARDHIEFQVKQQSTFFVICPELDIDLDGDFAEN